MHTALLLTFATRVLLPAPPSDVPKVDYTAAYGECSKAVPLDANKAIELCEQPAIGWVPGAQYALGALLTNRNSGDDMARGVEWLEKAVAGGHHAAKHHLAMLLAGRRDAASVARARGLLEAAVCAGYPAAVRQWSEAGGKQPASCEPSPLLEFSGEWSIRFTFEKTAPAGAGTNHYRIVIESGVPRVYMRVDEKWTEVKPGKFTMSQQDQTLTVSVSDTGWDLDGKWIETWTIQLMRTSMDEASAAFLRTVNNPDVPDHLSWRTFATFAEGHASRIRR